MKKINGLIILTAVLLYSSYSLAQPVVGQQAPDIALPNLRGKIVKLSEMTGQVVLVDFWASWCGPCRKANPNLLSLYNKYKRNGFEIFGVSLDEDEAAYKKAIVADKMSWIQVQESGGWEGPVASLWKVEEIPASYLLDRSGKIVAVNPEKTDLETKIIELLKKEP
ncbi:MAG: TlpA disulfide reductase family protein [Chitinophagaceae bacterium]